MIVLTLPYPLSANVYWHSRVITKEGRQMVITHPSRDAQNYKTEVGWRCKAAGVRAPIPGRVAISVQLYPHRPQDYQKRMRQLGAAWDDTVRCIDLDNANKVLLDALKGVAIEDDKWVRRLTSERMEPDGRDACVVVTIRSIVLERPQAGLGLDEPEQPTKEAAEEPLPF